MKAFQLVLLVSAAAAAASSQSFHFGKCPNPALQQDFNITRYMGTWYEVEKLPAVFEKGTCIQATYTALSDGSVRVLNQELLSNGQISSTEGVAKVEDPAQPAALAVSFSKESPPGPYWILSTDYKTYSVVYSCSQYSPSLHQNLAWILARSRTLDKDITSRLRGVLAAAGVHLDRLEVTNQTGCDAMA